MQSVVDLGEWTRDLYWTLFPSFRQGLFEADELNVPDDSPVVQAVWKQADNAWTEAVGLQSPPRSIDGLIAVSEKCQSGITVERVPGDDRFVVLHGKFSNPARELREVLIAWARVRTMRKTNPPTGEELEFLKKQRAKYGACGMEDLF